MENKDIEKIKSKIVKILKKHGIVRAGLFGSFARGENKKKSDVDILIEVDKNRKFSLLDFVGLKLELEDVLQKKVDLVEYSVIKKRIRNQILNDEVKVI